MSDDLMDRLHKVGELNETWSAEQLASSPTPPYPVDDLRPVRQARKLIPAAAAAVLLVALVAAAVAIAATNGDDPTEVEAADDPPPTSPPMDEPVDTGEIAEFCAAFNTIPEEVEESFVGSAEHVALLDELVAVAPEQILDDLTALRDHLDQHVDPSDPDSNLIENYPPEVRDAVESLEAYVADTC